MASTALALGESNFKNKIVLGLHQTAGVVLRKDFIAEEDAEVISLLRESGAIIIGLTNVPELCMWYVTKYILY